MTAGAFSKHLDDFKPFDVGQRGGAHGPRRYVIAAVIGRWEERALLQIVFSSSTLVHFSLFLLISFFFSLVRQNTADDVNISARHHSKDLHFSPSLRDGRGYSGVRRRASQQFSAKCCDPSCCHTVMIPLPGDEPSGSHLVLRKRKTTSSFAIALLRGCCETLKRLKMCFLIL